MPKKGYRPFAKNQQHPHNKCQYLTDLLNTGSFFALLLSGRVSEKEMNRGRTWQVPKAQNTGLSLRCFA